MNFPVFMGFFNSTVITIGAILIIFSALVLVLTFWLLIRNDKNKKAEEPVYEEVLEVSTVGLMNIEPNNNSTAAMQEPEYAEIESVIQLKSNEAYQSCQPIR